MTLRIPAPAFRWTYQVFAKLQPQRRARYHPVPQLALMESKKATQGAPGAIPRTIWSYWHATAPDAFVSRCIDNWRLHCPSFEIHVLNQATVRDHVPAQDLPDGFDQLNPVKQSDWIRLYLVSRHGGYWLDATILLTQSIEWLEALRQEHGAEFSGFYLDGYTQDERYPVVENWAFGAPAGAPFITAWQQEFHHALFARGTAAYLADLKEQTDGTALLQGIPDPVYLLGHVTAQRVLRRDAGFRLALVKAEDTAFFYQKAVRWKWYLLYPRLCLVPADAQVAPLVKLRGGERRHFAQLFAQHGDPVPGSLWQRACSAPPVSSV